MEIQELDRPQSEPERCPFCQSQDVQWLWGVRDLKSPIVFYCFCWNCRAKGPEAGNVEDAVELWNAPQTERRERQRQTWAD